MASARTVMPSSPPVVARGQDFISRLAMEDMSDDDLDTSLDQHLSDICSEDIDGPTDFTANLTHWMRQTQLREPEAHAIALDTEDEEPEAELIDEKDDKEARHVQNEAPKQVQSGPDAGLEEDDLDSDDELSSLLKELDSLEQQDQDQMDQKQPYQAFVEDGSDMPSMPVTKPPGRIPPPESDSHATSTRPASASSTADEMQSGGSETSVSTLQDEMLRLATTPPAAVALSSPAADSAQISQLLKSVQSLQTQLAQSMEALASQIEAQQAAETGHSNIVSAISSLQIQNRRDQEPVLKSIAAMQEQMRLSNAAVLEKLDEQNERSAQIDRERVQREHEQTAHIDKLNLELEIARKETASVREINSQLTTQLDEARQVNQVLEKDRMLMSKVLLDQWGREECGASQPQKYRYTGMNRAP